MKNNNENIYQEKISIVIPVYHVELYLRKCLNSVINQTYKNLEIIIVDDGSDDRCPEICDEYAQIDDRIIVIHKENRGLSAARNTGIDIATGNYIGFVDSDDWIESDMYEKLYSKAILHKADIVICGYYIVQNNKIHTSNIFYEDKLYSKESGLIELLKSKKIQSFAWDKLYRRELFDEIRYPVGYVYEDVLTTYKLFAIANTIVSIGDIMYYYVQRVDSITREIGINNRFNLFVANNKRYCDISKNFPTMEFELYRLVSELALRTYIHWIIDKASNRRKNLFIKNDLRNKIKNYHNNKYYSKLTTKLRLGILLSLLNSFIFENMVRIAYKFYNKNKKTQHMLEKFAGIFVNKSSFKSQVKEPSIYIIATPEHNNMGDHAIAFAELEYLKDNFPNYNIVEVPDDSFYSSLYSLKRNIKKFDIIILNGGGNIGNQYQVYEDMRKVVIKKFRDNKIIIFPQTIYFTNDNAGNKQLRISKRIYQKHKDLTIIAREKFSYDIMKKHFIKNAILLTPDIVMYIKDIFPKALRKGALLCFRDDIEGIIEEHEIQSIRDLVNKHFDKVIETDTCLYNKIKMDERNMALEAKWYQFSKAELVITDRLHGLVFAAITETPCICISNYNHKVEGTYKWIEHLPYIQYLNSLDQLESTINMLRNLDSMNINYDNTFAINHYEKIKDAMLQDKAVNQISKDKLSDIYNHCHSPYKHTLEREEPLD